MIIYFLIPVYNEAPNLELLSSQLINCLAEYEKYFVFVDDCSTDNTVELLKNMFATSYHFIIKKEKNQGPGDSFNRGFEWILNNSQNDDDIIVTLEGDNTSDLSILPDMVAISRLGYDLVLASPYAQGGGFDKTSFFRKFGSLTMNVFLRYFYDLKILTLSSFYRVYKKELLVKIKNEYFHVIKEDGFISMVEILVKSIRINAKIIEVPMKLFLLKRKGKSKMKVMKTFVSYIKFLFFQGKKNYNQKF